MEAHKKKLFVKAAILGDSSVGKTSIERRYTCNSFKETYKATIGWDFRCKNMKVNIKTMELTFHDLELLEDDEMGLTLQLWDTAGQERFMSLGYVFYRGTNIFYLVYSILDRESYRNLKKWLNTTKDAVNNAQYVLIGNVWDCEGKREVSADEGAKFALKYNMPFFETSAKTNLNINKAIEMGIRIFMTEYLEDHGLTPYKEEPARIKAKNPEPVDKICWQ
jgi:small GTP-binding protein